MRHEPHGDLAQMHRSDTLAGGRRRTRQRAPRGSRQGAGDPAATHAARRSTLRLHTAMYALACPPLEEVLLERSEMRCEGGEGLGAMAPIGRRRMLGAQGGLQTWSRHCTRGQALCPELPCVAAPHAAPALTIGSRRELNDAWLTTVHRGRGIAAHGDPERARARVVVPSVGEQQCSRSTSRVHRGQDQDLTERSPNPGQGSAVWPTPGRRRATSLAAL